MADEDELITEEDDSDDSEDVEGVSDTDDDDDSDDDDSSSESESDSESSGGEAKPAAKRGRPAKEPPPPKLWRLEGTSPEGLRVTLGRYVNKEEADPDLERLEEDGFYQKLKITKAKEE